MHILMCEQKAISRNQACASLWLPHAGFEMKIKWKVLLNNDIQYVKDNICGKNIHG